MGAGAGDSGSAQFLAAMPATRPSTSVQGAAFRAGEVHGTGKEVGESGTYPQDDDQQRNLEKHVAHGRPTSAVLRSTCVLLPRLSPRRMSLILFVLSSPGPKRCYYTLGGSDLRTPRNAPKGPRDSAIPNLVTTRVFNHLTASFGTSRGLPPPGADTPAFQTRNIDLASTLRAMSAGVVGARGTAWVRSSLLVLQVCLNFVLLVGAGLLIESLHRFELPARAFQFPGSSILPYLWSRRDTTLRRPRFFRTS